MLRSIGSWHRPDPQHRRHSVLVVDLPLSIASPWTLPPPGHWALMYIYALSHCVMLADQSIVVPIR
jgi:hypothetical protein